MSDEETIEVWDPGYEELIEEAMNCRILWLCVLYRSVQNYVKTKRAQTLQGRYLHEEVKSWLFSDDDDYINSFANLCAATRTSRSQWRDLAAKMSPHRLIRLELNDYRRASGDLYTPENSDRN